MMLKTASLPPSVIAIIQDKGTEYPFTGEYNDSNEPGTYLCRQCGLALFRSTTKFHSGCGWPSFDEEIAGTVKRVPDQDGQRIEILCQRCQAHLGHVFTGEYFTAKNLRHCVNSLSLDFVTDEQVTDTQEAIYAAGCFWGVEYYLKKCPGVLKVEVGYTGGQKDFPTYQEVCQGHTGHLEAVRVIFDPQKISFTQLTQLFFEIHDPTQADGQGPDKGAQYLSAIFYYDENQKHVSQALIQELKDLGYAVVTQLLPVTVFWPAEDYHQDYYEKTGKFPYCHHYEKKFPDK